MKWKLEFKLSESCKTWLKVKTELRTASRCELGERWSEVRHRSQEYHNTLTSAVRCEWGEKWTSFPGRVPAGRKFSVSESILSGSSSFSGLLRAWEAASISNTLFLLITLPSEPKKEEENKERLSKFICEPCIEDSWHLPILWHQAQKQMFGCSSWVSNLSPTSTPPHPLHAPHPEQKENSFSSSGNVPKFRRSPWPTVRQQPPEFVPLE